MSDDPISQLPSLSKAGLAAGDLLPIVDVSTGTTKSITAQDLVGGGVDLISNSEIDLAKLDQASVTKLGTAALADNAVTYAKLQNVSATDRLLGRSSAGAGDVEEIACTAAGRALLDDADAAAQRTTLGLGTLATQSGTFSGTHSGASSGTNTGDQTITLTGDVTGTGTGTFAATIANDAVTYGKLQNTSGTDVLLGRSSAGAGNVEEIPCTAAGRDLIDAVDAAEQRATLGLGDMATQSANAVNIAGGTLSGVTLSTGAATITGGTVTGITDLAVADGGTGASTAAEARANLGLQIGANVQAYDPALQSIAGLATSGGEMIYTTAADTYATAPITAAGRALIDDADAAAQRVTLGLGSVATANAITATELATGAVTGPKLANGSTNRLATSLPASGDYHGQLAELPGGHLYSWSGSAWTPVKGAGSVNTIAVNNAGTVIDLTASVSGDQVTLSAAPENTAAANQFLAGPTNAGGAVAYRVIDATDLPTASTTAKGAVQVNGEGLRMDGTVIEVDNDVAAGATHSVVTYNAKGLITGGRAIQSGDLPVAGASTNGAVQPGTGLAVTPGGVLNHSNSVTGATATKVTYDNQGHITSSTALVAGDIPDLPASKITSGTFSASRIGNNSITGIKLADSAVVQFGGPGTSAGIVSFPTPEYKGQYFYDEINEDLYLWNGNAWKSISIIGGELVFCGIYDASVNQVSSVTSAGTALGLTAGSALPAAAAANERAYVVVGKSGTGTAPAPAVALAPPDYILSTGAAWLEVDLSTAIGSQTATNTSVTPAGTISSTNVQAALEELDTEKLAKAGGTVTGELLIGTAGSLVFEGTTANDFETTVAVTDPTADRTITLPDTTGTVVTTGDSGTVTSTMIADGTITNGDINASAGIAFSKLANVSATDKLLGRSSSGAGAIEEITCTSAGRALLDDVDAAAQRTTLGLGTLATQSGTFSGTHSGTTSGTNTGDQTITLTGDVTGTGTGTFAATIAADAVTTAKILNSNVTYAKLQNVSATDRLLGRVSSGAGVVEEITCTAAGRALIDDASAADQRTTLGLGSLATLSAVGTSQITDKNVTYAKIQDVSATDRILGRSSAGAGVVEEITCTAAGRALIDDADAAAQRTTLGLGTIATLAAPSGSVVGTTDTQTLTNKTLGNYTETVYTVVDGGTVNLNPNNGPIQTWTLGASRTPGEANWAAGQSITLLVDDGSAYSITWSTLNVTWKTDGGTAPTLNTSGFTVIVLWKVGSTIYGARVGDA